MNVKEVNPFDRLPPYLVVDGFLGNDLIERLLEYAKAREGEFVPSKVGYGDKGGRIDPVIRFSRVLKNLGELRTKIEALFREVMQQAIIDLKLSPFELADCEIELVAHNDGAFFKRHIDTQMGIPDEKTQRILTGVLYFHSMPKGFSGGQFRLFPLNPLAENFVDIDPERDRLVLFPAWAPHEVMPISCPSGEFAQSRFAINCWYRRPESHNQHAGDKIPCQIN